MASETIARVVDAQGLSCPMPIFQAKKGIQAVEIGQVIEVLCTDAGSMADFKAFAKSTGHELLLAEQNDKVYRFLLRRTK